MVMVPIMITVVVLTIITIPVALGVPLMVAVAPPCMMQSPAALALSVQIASPVIRLVAKRSVFADRVVESDLCPFNALLALCSFIGLRAWRRHKQRKDA